MTTLSRQRNWQIKHPEKAKLLKKQTAIRQRYHLLGQGYVRTHEEIWDIIDGYERRNGKVSDEDWWNIYEYLDWKYNNCLLTKPPTHTTKSPTKEKIKSNIFSYYVGGLKHGHPAPFSEDLAKDHITTWSNAGDLVLDPFLGSGTSTKAAQDLNRNYIGIEINPDYVKIAQDRLKQLGPDK